MREILTIIAACLVVVLTAALAISPFVDWDAQRGRIEARLAAELGGTAEIGGPVSLRLLPAPRLTVGALSVERPGLTVRSSAAAFELSPTALLRGRLDFTEAALDQADVSLTPSDIALDAMRRARVGVARLKLTDASLRIGGEQAIALRHVDLSGSADSLAGPFRGTGVWRNARKIDFAWSTGAAEDGAMRAKLVVDDSSGAAGAPVHAEFDGDVSLAGDTPSFAGNATATGAAEKGRAAPWRVAFALKAAPGAVHAANIDARLGDEDHALNAMGDADYHAGAPLAVKLSARNLDFDRFRAAYGLPSIPGRGSWPDVKLDLSAETATLGGETIAAPTLSLRATHDAPMQATLDAELPGRSHARYSGVLDTADKFGFDGEAKFSTRDPKALADWIAPAAPDVATIVAASPFRRIDVSAAIRGGADSFEATVNEAALDRSRFAGVVSFTPARDGGRAKLAARMTSPALDVDGLPDLSSLAALGGDLDIALALDAQAIKIARFGKSSADAGRIALRAARNADGLSIDRLAVADLGGANLTGSGRFTQRGGGLDLRLDAEKLSDLASLVRRVAPSAVSDAFFVRAQALSPAHLSFGIATAGPSKLAQVDLSGEAGGTRLSAHIEPKPGDPGRIQASAQAEAADASVLLRQFGLPVLRLKGLGAGRLDAQGEGALEGAIRTSVRLTAAGAHVDFAGDVDLSVDHATASGALSAQTNDLTPLIQMFALGAPDLAKRLPAKGEARLTLAQDSVELDDLSMSVAGVRARGRLARDNSGKLVGALSLDDLSAPFLASLVLGPAEPAAAGALWPQIRFAPTAFDPPVADLDLGIAHFDLGGAVGGDARMKLALAPDALSFRELAMKVGGGTLSGEGSLTREVGGAMVKARLAIDNIAVAAGPFAARASGRIDVSGAGASMSQLAGSLAGAGHARFSDATIARAAPDALARVVAAADSDDASVEHNALAKSFAAALGAGAQGLEPFEGDVGLAVGRLALAPVSTRAGDASARIGGGLDLRSGALDMRELLALPPPKGWTGAPPSLALAWTGDFRSPARSVQADGLVAVLAERAIARETARNAALEADIRERVFFNRRLKFDRRLEAARRAGAETQRKADEAARADAARLEKERLDQQRTEKLRAEKDRRAPPAVSSPPPPPVVDRRPARAPTAFTPTPGGAAPDPSTAGRY